MSLTLDFVSCVVKNLPEVPVNIMEGWVNHPEALQEALGSTLVSSKKNLVDDSKTNNLIIESGKKTAEFLTLVVNYSRSLKDSIKAGGYDWVNSDITEEHFPAEKQEKGKKEQSFSLYHFGKDAESDWVIVQMDKDGKRPATIRELLVYGEKFPETQRQFPIIELGSVWVRCGGNCDYAYLDSSSGGRDLDLNWYGFRWHDYCRFLAVGK